VEQPVSAKNTQQFAEQSCSAVAYNLKHFVPSEVECVADKAAVTATVVGAIIGGVAGYLFFTERGRALRRQIEPALDDIARELNSFRGTVQRAAGVANEGWRLLNEALGDGGGSQPTRYPSPHQTTPF
jgi:hypothetical protein